MKKNLLAIVVATLVLSGCVDQQLLSETSESVCASAQMADFNALIERARWGDGQAYLELADCYRDGKGVEKDIVGMLTMAALAERYGGIGKMEEYMRNLPEGSDYKLFCDAVEMLERKKIEESLATSEIMLAQGSPEGYTLKSILAVERGDSLEGMRLMEQAASQGSSFAGLVLCLPEFRDDKKPDVERLKMMADRMPFACQLLGEVYTGRDDESLRDDRLAAFYYMKADEHACLDRRGARWLLSYYRHSGDLPLSERDVERLQILAQIEPVEDREPVSVSDEALEDAVSQMLQEKMIENECITGAVYVVETQTGGMKARVSFKREGNSFVPYVDTFADEQCCMLCAPTYLALLSTGMILPNDTIDTECGVYKDVKDHNWYRGGYGKITLEQAVGYRSKVAFTKAGEKAFGANMASFDEKVNSYLAGNPNHVFGILTFYNAVANGGKMVQLVTEEGNVIVLDEQIAAPEHVKMLQRGLRRAVSHGLYRKAESDKTEVAACGRSFLTTQKYRRMELCGYFPADSPMYTIMVVLEKNSLPGSAGGMCGPIMTNTIDILVDSYDLRSDVARNGNSDAIDDSDVVIVDTVAAQ